MKFKGPIHFIGIGGAGMAGIAELLHRLGYTVTGSDLNANKMTDKLEALNITVHYHQSAAHCNHAQTVVYSSAIADDNPELVAAYEQDKLVLHRAQMLALIMNAYFGIVVTGTHGKTSTSGLISSLLLNAGLDPSFIIGGYMQEVGSHAHLGHSQYMVCEADESDASFLNFSPDIAVITNIDYDHMLTYGHDLNNYKKALLTFVSQMPDDGLVILCMDDPHCRELIPDISRPVLTYGFHEKADLKGVNCHQQELVNTVDIQWQNNADSHSVQLSLPGRHNAQNAMAAVAVSRQLNVSWPAIQKAMLHFGGLGRRFEYRGDIKLGNGHKAPLYDDYAHHPGEIKALVDSARTVWPQKRLLAIFQPHRHTRTQHLWQQFIECLSVLDVDALAVMDIYSAGEPPRPGINSARLVESLNRRTNNVAYVQNIAELSQWLEQNTDSNDVVLAVGAGDINTVMLDFINDDQAKKV